jgi:hypothetical protein
LKRLRAIEIRSSGEIDRLWHGSNHLVDGRKRLPGREMHSASTARDESEGHLPQLGMQLTTNRNTTGSVSLVFLGEILYGTYQSQNDLTGPATALIRYRVGCSACRSGVVSLAGLKKPGRKTQARLSRKRPANAKAEELDVVDIDRRIPVAGIGAYIGREVIP